VRLVSPSLPRVTKAGSRFALLDWQGGLGLPGKSAGGFLNISFIHFYYHFSTTTCYYMFSHELLV
jgi:hypothetical protein